MCSSVGAVQGSPRSGSVRSFGSELWFGTLLARGVRAGPLWSGLELRMPARSIQFAEGLTLLKRGRLDVLVRRAEQDPLKKGEVLLGSVGPGLTGNEIGVLLSGYERLNARDLGPESTPAIHGKAMALALACARAATPRTLSRLRQTLGRIELSPSSRPLVLVDV